MDVTSLSCVDIGPCIDECCAPSPAARFWLPPIGRHYLALRNMRVDASPSPPACADAASPHVAGGIRPAETQLTSDAQPPVSLLWADVDSRLAAPVPLACEDALLRRLQGARSTEDAQVIIVRRPPVNAAELSGQTCEEKALQQLSLS